MDEELRELGRQVQTEAAENNQGNAKDEDQDEQEFPQINASVYRERNEDYVAYLYVYPGYRDRISCCAAE